MNQNKRYPNFLDRFLAYFLDNSIVVLITLLFIYRIYIILIFFNTKSLEFYKFSVILCIRQATCQIQKKEIEMIIGPLLIILGSIGMLFFAKLMLAEGMKKDSKILAKIIYITLGISSIISAIALCVHIYQKLI